MLRRLYSAPFQKQHYWLKKSIANYNVIGQLFDRTIRLPWQYLAMTGIDRGSAKP